MAELALDFTAMGSDGQVRACGNDRRSLEIAARRAVAELRRIERKYSRYRSDSVVSRINAGAGTGIPIEVDDETGALLDFADRLHALSGGRFDITSGVLRRVWDFRRPRVPAATEIEPLLALIGWQRVWRGDGCVGLTLPGMEIDFGGIGKEYAADRAAAALADAGIHHGFVNLGGDIRLLGPRDDGRPWTFGIQHPRRADGLLGEVELSCGALATSGDYERFIEVDGRRFCHLLDPRSGWPVDQWQSVSVLAPTCAAAGALCTLAMLHAGQALDFLDAQQADYLANDRHGLAHAGGRWIDRRSVNRENPSQDTIL